MIIRPPTYVEGLTFCCGISCARPLIFAVVLFSTVPTDSAAAECDFFYSEISLIPSVVFTGGGFINASLASIFLLNLFEPPSFRNEKQKI